MLLAPILPMSLNAVPVRRRAKRRGQGVDPAVLASQRRWLLIAWSVLGSLAVLCIPALRGGVQTGWTLPFWLVAAPLINLGAIAWLRRARRP